MQGTRINEATVAAKRRGFRSRRTFGPAAFLEYQRILDSVGETLTVVEASRPADSPPRKAVALRHDVDHDLETAVQTFGVLKDGPLVAYTWIHQVGKMCLFSTILGHGEHLNDGVMFLLVARSLERPADKAGTRYAMYNMHYSGTDGLRFFKDRLGFGRIACTGWRARGSSSHPRPGISLAEADSAR